MTSLLCHINNEGFTAKPTNLKFMGALRDKLIQKPWDYVDEDDFVDKVTAHGYAFYGCIFNGHDLMHCDSQTQRGCWRAQSIVAVDIDKCTVHPRDMCKFYTDLGLIPWLAYTTFSDRVYGLRSYRLMWKVDVDHSITYEKWAEVIKALSNLTEHGDKRARDCTRMWQGSHNGPEWYVRDLRWSYSQLADRLGLL